jgi:hypothetical protein
MPVYVERIGGYVADNPNIDFLRDGVDEVYSYYEVSTANMNATNNVLSITGGQGNYPLAYIPTDRALEFTFASSEFTLDMFGMANDTPLTPGDTNTLESKFFNVETGLKITIPYQTKEKSIRIKGFAESATTTAAAGKFAVNHGTGNAPKTEITFFAGDAVVGDKMRIAYKRRVNAAQMVTVLTTSKTANGSLFAHWPVYSSGTDINQSAIKGYLHLTLPRVRVTALPGFDTSYKSAATNSITFAAVDPKDAGEQMYTLTYEPLDLLGNIVTTPSPGVTEW